MEIREKFIEFLEVNQGLAPATMREYRRMIGLFHEEAGGDHPWIPIRAQSEYEDVVRNVAARFLWSPGTRYRFSILIESYGRYAYRERLIERIPYENTFAKGNGKRVEFFTEDDFYKVTFNPFHSISDFVMMILFWDCAMRKSELIALNVEDVLDTFQQRLVKIVNIKTGKVRYNPVTKFTHIVLTFYLITLAMQGKLKRGNPLFYSPTWERLHESTLARHMRDSSEGSQIRVFAHKFRHSLARILTKGADRFLLRDLLGHENFNTTAIYTHFETVKKREMYDSLVG